MVRPERPRGARHLCGSVRDAEQPHQVPQKVQQSSDLRLVARQWGRDGPEAAFILTDTLAARDFREVPSEECQAPTSGEVLGFL
jgi:hypothetical protein